MDTLKKILISIVFGILIFWIAGYIFVLAIFSGNLIFAGAGITMIVLVFTLYVKIMRKTENAKSNTAQSAKTKQKADKYNEPGM